MRTKPDDSRKRAPTASSTDSEILEVVDRDDKVLGTTTRREIHDRNLMHRAVHVFLFDPEGRIYVQRRSATKDRHPSQLDSSAAGHVDPGESYETAAAREFSEELGIRTPLTEVLRVQACDVTDNEHVVLFATQSSSAPSPNPDEIAWGGFMTADELGSLMDYEPDDFVPAFVLLWKAYLRRRT